MTQPALTEGLRPDLGPTASTKSQHSNANRQRHLSNLRKFGTPLPILLPQSYPRKPQPFLSTFIPSFLSQSSPIECPTCTGTYDPITRSVIVTDKKDIDILFQRGFFGKGSLSRSEPTWRERRLDILRDGGSTFHPP